MTSVASALSATHLAYPAYLAYAAHLAYPARLAYPAAPTGFRR